MQIGAQGGGPSTPLNLAMDLIETKITEEFRLIQRDFERKRGWLLRLANAVIYDHLKW